ncbi:MAG TPA: hypothetical protein VHX39_23635 [Acetobacteraceae bacterium]|jgi:hypothetical protein|nr:hypothetical protein [Acetobacteraceae bacterium]
MSSFISHVIGPEQLIFQCPGAVSILLAMNNALHQGGPSALQSRAVVLLLGDAAIALAANYGQQE